MKFAATDDDDHGCGGSVGGGHQLYYTLRSMKKSIDVIGIIRKSVLIKFHLKLSVIVTFVQTELEHVNRWRNALKTGRSHRKIRCKRVTNFPKSLIKLASIFTYLHIYTELLHVGFVESK
jgi:hypothetical protein